MSTPQRHPGGRPTKYKRSLALSLASDLSNPSVSIEDACHRAGIEPQTMYNWAFGFVDRRPAIEEFFDLYARAMEIRWRRTGDGLADLSDQNVIVGDRSDSARVRQAESRIKTRMWVLSKRLPEVYGDRLQVEAQMEFAVVDLRPASLKEAEKRAGALEPGSKMPTTLPPRDSGGR